MTIRVRYVLLALATIAIGLLVHLHGLGLPRSLRDIAGDALWAAMIFWLMSFVLPRARRLPRAAAALAFCFLVELSQRIEQPWLESVRGARFGHLLLGSDFDARDLLAYAAGVALAGLADYFFQHQRNDRQQKD